MDHPNIDPRLNKLITEQEKRGGIDLTKLAVGTTVEARTKNSSYFIEVLGNGDYKIRGGKHFPTTTVMGISGSTWGGSMIKLNWLAIGMHIEFSNRVTTTEVQALKVIGADGSWGYDL